MCRLNSSQALVKARCNSSKHPFILVDQKPIKMEEANVSIDPKHKNPAWFYFALAGMTLTIIITLGMIRELLSIY